MKYVIPTITVLTVFSLAIVSSVPAQNSRQKENEAMKKALTDAEIKKIKVEKAIREAAKEQIEVENAIREAQIKVEKAIREADADDARMAAKTNIENILLNMKTQFAGSQEQRVRGSVLVVPTTEMKTEDFASIMQDMNIMARIFDKKLNYPLRLNEGETIVIGGLLAPTSGKHFISGDDKATKAIYVEGYGALFFIKVKFPLSPPEEVKLEKIEEGMDPVWEETKQEIYTPKEAHATIVASTDDMEFEKVLKSLHAETSALPQYDAEKVDELKRKLIKTLKHAANIQSLKPQDWVVLAVTGTPQPAITTQIRLIHDEKDGDTIYHIIPKIQEAKPTSPSSTVLTIRVKKSDIDAFFKGELDFDKFRERTQILTSRAKLGEEKSSKVDLNVTDPYLAL